MLEFIKWLQTSDYIRGISFAIFGGFVRVLTTSRGRLRFKPVFSGLLTAAFVGVIWIEVINYYELNKNILGLLNVLSGYCHKEMVDLMVNKFLTKIKKTNDKF